jgi:RNA methyltransferase, TrmH family
MISKSKMNYVVSLQKKKVRDEEGLYIIEGDKMVREYLQGGMRIRMLVAKPEFIAGIPPEKKLLIDETEAAGYDDLKHISTLKTPHNALALVEIPENRTDPPAIYRELSAALDFIQDPGNFGTILRAAAWFGIRHVVCSDNCVDAYNPKVVQASMGALLNVRVSYCNLDEFLSGALRKKINVYGTVLDGDPIYSTRLSGKGIILLGNESKGISPGLRQFVTRPISIPKFTEATTGIESLNVGMAASVIFSEFARR